MAGTTTKRRTKYQIAKAAARRVCEGKGSVKVMNDAIERYKTDALKKGKTATEVNRIIADIKKCPVVNGTKKATTTRKKK